jgi:hypothetical protein
MVVPCEPIYSPQQWRHDRRRVGANLGVAPPGPPAEAVLLGALIYRSALVGLGADWGLSRLINDQEIA